MINIIIYNLIIFSNIIFNYPEYFFNNCKYGIFENSNIALKTTFLKSSLIYRMEEDN